MPPLIEGISFDALIAGMAFDSNAIVAELDARGAKAVIAQHPVFGDRRAQALLASDDAEAKVAAAALAEAMGYEPVDADPLANARFIEPLGAPTLALEDVPARRFLRQAAGLLGRPSALLVASAHWESHAPLVSAMARNGTIHDFGRGFPRALFGMRYDAPGAPALAERVVDLLAAAGPPARTDARRGLGHGAWIPLSQLWPDADIPVLQVSIQSQFGPAHHPDLGRALAPLRAEGVLVLGSGSFTHDLEEFFGQAPGTPEPDWVAAFADWTARRC